MVIAIGHNRRRARSSSFTTPSDSSSGNYGAGRTLVVSLLQLHVFFRICFIIYIKPYRYLTIWPSELLDFGLLAIQTSDFWLSGLQTSRLWISGLQNSGLQTSDFWPSRLLAIWTTWYSNFRPSRLLVIWPSFPMSWLGHFGDTLLNQSQIPIVLPVWGRADWQKRQQHLRPCCM